MIIFPFQHHIVQPVCQLSAKFVYRLDQKCENHRSRTVEKNIDPENPTPANVNR